MRASVRRGVAPSPGRAKELGGQHGASRSRLGSGAMVTCGAATPGSEHGGGGGPNLNMGRVSILAAEDRVLSRVKPKTAPTFEPAFWGKSESRAWKYARFLVSSSGPYGFPHGAKIWRGLGLTRDRTSCVFLCVTRALPAY